MLSNGQLVGLLTKTNLGELLMVEDVALLILRIALGIIFLVHGLPKRGLWNAKPASLSS